MKTFPLDDASFRDAVDARGFFPPSRAAEIDEREAFLVFAQRGDARVAIDALARHARRFFDADVGLAVDKRYTPDAPPPRVDAARLVVSSTIAGAGTRTILGRPATLADRDAAEVAEREGRGGGGLALLARRCESVWLVACEGPTPDTLALLLAAILAAVDLGPILPPGRDALFGVKTARIALGLG